MPGIYRAILSSIVLCVVAIAQPSKGFAQIFPNKPITIVEPYAVGGTTDVLIRAMQDRLQKELGQPVVIQSKPGASGIVATRFVAKAPADGYTLLLHTSAIVISPFIYKDSDYDVLRDFEPITMLGAQPFVLVSNPTLPVHNLPELIAYAKQNPGKIMFGSSGPASYGRLATELMMRRAGISMSHVPYKGVGDIMLALLRGDVQLMLSTTSPQTNAYIKQGRLNLLGVSSLEPSPLLPGAEPIAKTLDGFRVEVWYGLLAPRGTAPQAVMKIHDAVTKVLATAEVRAAFENAGATVVTITPEQFKAQIKQESDVWADVVKDVGITE
jgi:tripartite-type tricarboxylate transporter receptor subunit TctC